MTLPPLVHRSASDIRIWILLFFCIRLIGITHAPLETGHNWRQTTVTMVARNFVEVEADIMHPRIDIAGEKTGITGMEFPLLNYGIYLVSEGFGYAHWYGRFINLLISSLGIWYFYRILQRFFTDRMALYSTLLLLSSIWFSFSRKIMPDTFAVSLVIISIYHVLRFLYDADSAGRKHLFFYLLLGMAGMASKLPAGFLYVILLLPVLDKKVDIARKIQLVVMSILMLLPPLLWYFFWVPHLVAEYGFWHYFMGVNIAQAWSELQGHWLETASRFYDDAMKFIGFGLFVLGTILAFRNKERRLLLLFLIGTMAFAVIILKAGRTFYHHNYYIIPYVPIMAMMAGYGLSTIRKNLLVYLLLGAAMLEGTINQSHDFKIKDKYAQLLQLEQDLDEFTEREDLILMNSGEYPTPMYFAHRKGWVNYNEQLASATYLDSLEQKGLKAIVVLKRVFGTDVQLDEPQVHDTEDYRIYLLD